MSIARSANRQAIAKHFNVDADHLIFSTIDSHFADIFDLDALTDELKSYDKTTYFKHCELIIKAVLEAKPNSLVNIIAELQTKLLTTRVDGKLLIKVQAANIGLEAHSVQIGFAEKLFSNRTKLAPMEPLTRLDMIRIREKKHLSLHITTRAILTDSPNNNNDVTLINLENDTNKAARWIAYDAQNKRVYAEFEMTEDERKWLQSLAPGIKLSYSGNTVSDAITSGYAVLRWYDQTIYHSHNFAPGSDRWMLRHEMIRWYEQSMSVYTDKKYCHPGFLKLLNGDSFGLSAFEHLSRASWLGDMNNKDLGEFESNNMSALLNQIDVKNINSHKLTELWNIGVRFCIPGLDLTMKHLKMIIIDADKDEISFSPDRNAFNDINVLRKTHNQACGFYFNTSLFDNASRNLHDHVTAEDLAATMIVSFFRVFATKRRLIINLDAKLCQLNAEEISIICSLMRDNTDVTDIIVNAARESNASLTKLVEALTPVLARNRLLVANNYRPSLAGDHWLEAGFYALQYFNDEHNQDLLTHPTPQKHAKFLTCIDGMSLTGLAAILRCLQARKSRLQFLFGEQRPGFLVSCHQDDLKKYLTQLTAHLVNKDNYFPFAAIGAKYLPGADKEFAELITVINQRGSFEHITLTNMFDKASPEAMLDNFIARAAKEKWCVLINIPELDDISKLTDAYRTLHDKYARLNNYILQNRREVEVKKLMADLAASKAQQPNINAGSAPVALQAMAANESGNDNNAPLVIDLNADEYEKRPSVGERTWPLSKGPRASLQQQQQMQHEEQQQQQHEKQHQRKAQSQLAKSEQQEQRNVPLNMQLVNYKNADALLTPIVDEIKKDFPDFKLTVTPLANESLMQAFFRTCISANPNVEASFVIREMTQDAARKLLFNHSKLNGGLDIEGLPRGFWTQRDENDAVILCYSKEYGYQQTKTAFTLDLDRAPLAAKDWLGDGRQFLQEEKLSSAQQAILFSTAQPNLPKLDARYEAAFKRDKHGLTFKQHWQTNQVSQFENLAAKDFELESNTLWKALLGESYSNIQAWLARTPAWSNKNVTAVAQVYNVYGQAGMSILMNRLAELSNTLGDTFFAAFKKQFIDSSHNLCELLTPTAFRVLDEMQARFVKNEDAKNLWTTLANEHIAATGWDALQTMWLSYCDFNDNTLARLELRLNHELIQKLPIGNMQPFMVRVKRVLENLTTTQARQTYLDQITTTDLHHGGVHYALNYEKFRIYHSNLDIENFNHGSPTYSPPLREIYNWQNADIGCYVRRSLAQWKKITQDRYLLLTQDNKLINNEASSKDALILILTTQFGGDDKQLVDNIAAIKREPSLAPIAKHMHHAVYVVGAKPEVDLSSLPRLTRSTHLAVAMQRFALWPQGAVLELASILASKNAKTDALYDKELAQCLQLLAENIQPSALQIQALKIAAICGIYNAQDVNAFIQQLNAAPSPEITQFIQQLLSIDFELSDHKKLPKMAEIVFKGVAAINQQPDRAGKAAKRLLIMQELRSHNLHFKVSANGSFRRLEESDNNGLFIEQYAYLNRSVWPFLKAYAMVPTDKPLNDVLLPLIEFFHRLHNKKVEVNEYLQLQILFQKTVKPGHFWTADTLHELLFSIEPANPNSTYPVSILSLMLKDPACAPKVMEEVSDNAPFVLYNAIQANILGARGFTRTEQTGLCQILLTVYQHSPHDLSAFNFAFDRVNAAHRDVRASLLNSLKTANTMASLQSVMTTYDQAKTSIDLIVAEQIEPLFSNLAETYHFWLSSPHVAQHAALFQQIQTEFADNLSKRSLTLHILAWSSLHQGLKTKDEQADELTRKAPKLVALCKSLTLPELTLIANCYPRTPMPTADDLRRLIKLSRTRNLPLADCLDEYKVNPHPYPRADYGQLPVTRRQDLKRMLQEMRVSRAESTAIDDSQYNKLIRAFDYLKKLESGKVLVNGCAKPIHQLSQPEIAEALQRLQAEGLGSTENRVQHWALLFEAIYRTTKLYPHMAQQVGIIANDLCIDAKKRAMRVQTGEGKTHMIALRAAHFALQGKQVAVLTPKRSLAVRDQTDYKGFFNFLDIQTSNIRDTSSYEDYTRSRVRYSTSGDFSLFLDNMSNNGTAIPVDPENNVALLDEFDYIRFEENYNTQYNYAASSGYTPFRSMWFYEAIFKFYMESKETLQNTQTISESHLDHFTHVMQTAAGKDKNRIDFLKKIIANSNTMVQWIQSAHTAMQLEESKHFVLIESDLLMSNEIYRLKEIVPLSKDNQRIAGSSFSEGVQQLLAVRLHMEGQKDVYVPPQNDIISSQIAENRMKQLWSIQEGYTGTIMPEQISALRVANGNKFEVLHMPTNQQTLRHWEKRAFFQNPDHQLLAMVNTLRECFAKKQSILFSCKDDTAVNKLKTRLANSKLLSEEEMAQFIFSTNADNRDGKDVLVDKKNAEQWERGQQGRGMALVTSSMNRGDNPDVGAVFLIDLADESDLLQRGGRTARGGEDGTVYQFLLLSEIENEYSFLQEQVDEMRSAYPGLSSNRSVSPIVGKSEDAICDAILELRKELQELVQHTTHQYHQMLSEFSTWTMDIFNQIKSNSQLLESTRAKWIGAIKAIAESWVDSASHARGDEKKALERIDKIKREMMTHATSLYDDCAKQANIMPLSFRQQHVAPVNQKIGDDQTTAESIARSNVIANIWMLMYSLNLATQSNGALEVVMNYLQSLKSTDAVLKFYNHIRVAQPTTFEPLLAYIETSASFNKLAASNQRRGMPHLPYDAEVKLRFFEPSISTAFVEGLQEYGLQEYTSLLLPYLAKFDATTPKQIAMAIAFIKTFPQLLNETPVALREARFNLPAMSLERFESIWSLVQTINPTSIEALTTVANVVCELSPLEERMLTSWEMLARQLQPEEKLAFFHDFCQVMHAAKQDARAWDNLQHLFRLTSKWWNKGGNAYQAELLTLWKKLNKHTATFAKLDHILTNTIGMKGKSWFKFLNETLDLEPEFIASNDEEVAANIQELHNDVEITKQEKSRFLKDCAAKFPDLLSLADAQTVTTLANLEATLPHSVIDDIKFIFDKKKSVNPQVDLRAIVKNYSDALLALSLNERKLTSLRPMLVDNINYLDVINHDLNHAQVDHRYGLLGEITQALDQYSHVFKEELFTLLRANADNRLVTPFLATLLADANIAKVIHRSSPDAKLRATMLENMQYLLTTSFKSAVSLTSITPFIACCPSLFTSPHGKAAIDMITKCGPTFITSGCGPALSGMLTGISDISLNRSSRSLQLIVDGYMKLLAVLPMDAPGLAAIVPIMNQNYTVLDIITNAVKGYQPSRDRYQLITRYFDKQVFAAQQIQDIWNHAAKIIDDETRAAYFKLLDALFAINPKAISEINVATIMDAVTQQKPAKLKDLLENIAQFAKQIDVTTNGKTITETCVHFVATFAATAKSQMDELLKNLPANALTPVQRQDVWNYLSKLESIEHQVAYVTIIEELLKINPARNNEIQFGLINNSLTHAKREVVRLATFAEFVSNIPLNSSAKDVHTYCKLYLETCPLVRTNELQSFIDELPIKGLTPQQLKSIWSFVGANVVNLQIRSAYLGLVNKLLNVNKTERRNIRFDAINEAITNHFKTETTARLLEMHEIIDRLRRNLSGQALTRICVDWIKPTSIIEPQNLPEMIPFERLEAYHIREIAAYAAAQSSSINLHAYLNIIQYMFRVNNDKFANQSVQPLNTILNDYHKATERELGFINVLDFMKRYTTESSYQDTMSWCRTYVSVFANMSQLTARELLQTLPIKGMNTSTATRVWHYMISSKMSAEAAKHYQDCINSLIAVNDKVINDLNYELILAYFDHVGALDKNKLIRLKKFIDKLPRGLSSQELSDAVCFYQCYYHNNTADKSGKMAELLINSLSGDIAEMKYLLGSKAISLVEWKVEERHKPLFITAAKEFFALHQLHGNNMQALSESLNPLFDFSVPGTQQRRIAFMHHLFQDTLILKEDRTHAQTPWTHETNVQLRDKCFNRYIKETEAIIGERLSKPLKQEFDLTPEQQGRILMLSKEIQLIAGNKNANKLAVAAKTNKVDLLGTLNQHLDKYSDSWLKSRQRKAELAALKAQVNQRLADKALPNYETLLEDLRNAMSTAMADDRRTNESTWRRYFWPTHNSSGHSRYYHTLNRMHDAVLEAWSKDLNAMDTFGRYRTTHLMTEISSLGTSLRHGIESILQVPQNSLARVNMATVAAQLSKDWNLYSMHALWKLSKHQAPMQTLIQGLAALSANAQVFCNDAANLTNMDSSIEALLEAIPSHMAAQFKELQHTVRLLAKHLVKVEKPHHDDNVNALFQR